MTAKFYTFFSVYVSIGTLKNQQVVRFFVIDRFLVCCHSASWSISLMIWARGDFCPSIVNRLGTKNASGRWRTRAPLPLTRLPNLFALSGKIFFNIFFLIRKRFFEKTYREILENQQWKSYDLVSTNDRKF